MKIRKKILPKFLPSASWPGSHPALQPGLSSLPGGGGVGPYPDELTTAEGNKLLDDLATLGQVVVILTGASLYSGTTSSTWRLTATHWATVWSWR